MRERRTAVVVVILLVVALSVCVSQPLAVRAASLDVEEAFNRLYERDRQFRDAVDEMRRIIRGDDFTEDDWIRFKKLFNLAMTKVGMPTLDVLNAEQLSVFRTEVERQARNVRSLKQRSTKALSIAPTMSDQQEIEIAKQFAPLLSQPVDDISSPASNGLKSVYADVHDENVYGHPLPGYYAIEVTLVFYDEDHPNPWL
ncbi:MAG: hypothetical protein ACE5Z5_10290, partial [Candidatus Bathyarchaeia archaeon]